LPLQLDAYSAGAWCCSLPLSRALACPHCLLPTTHCLPPTSHCPAGWSAHIASSARQVGGRQGPGRRANRQGRRVLLALVNLRKQHGATFPQLCPALSCAVLPRSTLPHPASPCNPVLLCPAPLSVYRVCAAVGHLCVHHAVGAGGRHRSRHCAGHPVLCLGLRAGAWVGGQAGWQAGRQALIMLADTESDLVWAGCAKDVGRV